MTIKIVIGFFLIVCVIVAGVFFSTPATFGQKSDIDEGTIVYRGQVTDKERAYSKEYKKSSPLWRGRKFSELIAESETRGDGTGELGGHLGAHEGFYLPDTPAVTPAEFLAKLSCVSDAVVIGSVTGKSSHMTEDEAFIYTAYEFSIQNILKDNHTSPIDVESTIEITRPGGLVNLENRRIRIEDRSYIPLQDKKTYMLFLRFVPSANGYMAASPEGDFILESSIYKRLSTRPLPKQLQGNIDSQLLSADVHKAVLSGCSQKAVGGR